MFKPVLLAMGLLVAAPAWAINKCTGPDGKVAFQDAPCAGKGEKIEVRPASGPAQATAVAETQARVDKLKRDNEMSEAIRTHQPLVGMTAAQLEDSMGRPQRVNAANYNGEQHDQLIYERPDATWYVYTQNGVVRSIQRQQSIGGGQAADRRAQGRCPTGHEIKNAITAASSNYLSEVEREQRWKAIREMQRCGK